MNFFIYFLDGLLGFEFVVVFGFVGVVELLDG